MTVTKHSPVPWTYTPIVDGEGARKFVIQPVLAYVHRVDERDEANVRLMTEAPKLLKALKEIARGTLDGDTKLPMTRGDMMSIARMAIGNLQGE